MSKEHDDLTTRSQQTVGGVLASRVAGNGDKTWVVVDGREYSYVQLDRRSDRLAHGLKEHGVEQGDTVLLMLSDGVEIITAWLALAKLGAIEVPVNTHLKGTVLAHLVNDSGASTMIIHEHYVDNVTSVRRDLGKLPHLVVARTDDKATSRIEHATSEFPISSIEDLYRGECGPVANRPVFFDLIAVMYTSGTTGLSKGVMISHAHAYEYARGVVELLELQESDVYYNPLPLFHIAGQWAAVYATLIAGATVVIPGRFSPERFWPDIHDYGCTATFLLGAMANWLYRQAPTQAEHDNPMQRMLVVPLLSEIEDFKRRFGVMVSTTWGSTEINIPTRSGFDLANSKTCGRVAEDRYEVRIVDENDQEVAVGRAGEAVVRTREPWILMAGYWNNPEATATAWRNQWVHSGDMLMKDTEGNLYFIDRTKDAIRRRGENISSMEVENEINAHDGVLECAVIPVASEYTEQEVMAVVVAKNSVTIDPVELTGFLQARMANFMVPRYVDFVEALPKTATGKIQKFELRKRGVTVTTWDRDKAGVRLNKS